MLQRAASACSASSFVPPASDTTSAAARPATKNLLDAGYDERTAMSITGDKTFAAFAVYAGEADQRRLATDAIAKLEQKQ